MENQEENKKTGQEKSQAAEAADLSESEKNREEVVREKCRNQLIELFTLAGTPDSDTQKQDLSAQVEKMQDEELDYLGNSLKKIQAEYQASQDKGVLLDSLRALAGQDFHNSAQKAARTREDSEKLKHLRDFLGAK